MEPVDSVDPNNKENSNFKETENITNDNISDNQTQMPSTSNNYNANRNNNSNTINENFDAAPFRQNKNNYYN